LRFSINSNKLTRIFGAVNEDYRNKMGASRAAILADVGLIVDRVASGSIQG
jgi:hypothetical protein